MHQAAADRLPSLLRAAGIKRPIILGHSDGDLIALLFAALFRQQSSAVVAIAPQVFVEDKATKAIEAMIRAWATSSLRQKLLRRHGCADDLFNAWSQVWLSTEFAPWDIREQLPTIQDPLLVLQGMQDGFATDLQVSSIVRLWRECRQQKSGGFPTEATNQSVPAWERHSTPSPSS